jgi:hypothetical protein
MAVKYYTNLYEIDDTFRRKKYQALLLSSLQNDMIKWTETVKSDKVIYVSPDYNGTNFMVEIRINSWEFAYATYANPPITDRGSELICEGFTGDMKIQVAKLRETIFTPEIYSIEKLIGKQHDRKEKLDFLDVEQMKEIIEDTYQDWLKNDNIVVAKMIAKIMYSYRKKEEMYDLWVKRFEDIDLINNELKRLKG